MCTPDPPEIGDIGPVSELVYRDLEQRFPESIAAVANRTIPSSERVEVLVSVDGKSMVLGAAIQTSGRSRATPGCVTPPVHLPEKPAHSLR